jgi:hypothetical protein
MTTFDERERAYEKKFAMDEDIRFKVTVRRNKLLGLWAAEKMSISGNEAEEYAKSVVKADFEAPGDEDVVGKVLRDFQAKQVDQTEHQVRRTMTELTAVAMSQVEAEAKKAAL